MSDPGPQPRPWQIVCAVADIDDPGGFDFRMPGEWAQPAFVVRRGDSVFAYVNCCPHAGFPLNWTPGAFFTRDKSLLMCSAHGALFEIETGQCVAGPCPGSRLQALDARVRGGFVEVRTGVR